MAPDNTAQPETAQRALLEEALKKSSLLWLTLVATTDVRSSGGHGSDDGPSHPRWYAWTEGRVYLLTGRGEQPDPGLVLGTTVRVVVPSKDNRHRLVTFDAEVSALEPSSPDWGVATAELAKERLNLHDAEDAPRRWAGPDFALFRLTPRLPLVDESPDELAASHRATPPPTPATTSAGKPWVLHRRGGHGRRLS